MIYYLIVALGVFACSASQLLLKSSAMRKHASGISELLNGRILLAYGIMVAALVVNIHAMRNGVLLKDMPILESLGYVYVPLLSYIVLDERITGRSLGSIGLILVGICVFYL